MSDFCDSLLTQIGCTHWCESAWLWGGVRWSGWRLVLASVRRLGAVIPSALRASTRSGTIARFLRTGSDSAIASATSTEPAEGAEASISTWCGSTRPSRAATAEAQAATNQEKEYEYDTA